MLKIILATVYGLSIICYSSWLVFKEYKKNHQLLKRNVRLVVFFSISLWAFLLLLNIPITSADKFILYSSSFALTSFLIHTFIRESRDEYGALKSIKSSKPLITDIGNEDDFQPLIASKPIHEIILKKPPLVDTQSIFDYNCQYFDFSAAEYAIAAQIKSDPAISRKDLVDYLKGSVDNQQGSIRTVDAHIASIYQKMGVKRLKNGPTCRELLLQKLNECPKK